MPEAQHRKILSFRGGIAADWAANLPDLLESLTQRWSLVLESPYTYPSLSYVAPAVRSNGARCVLKVGFIMDELACEIAALRLFDGRAAVRLLDADEGLGALLLERLEPGTCLAEVAQDDEACEIAASVMKKLWRSPPAEHSFPTVADWGRGLQRLRERFGGGTGPLPAQRVDLADGLLSEILASAPPARLLHGDLQHFNVLRSARDGWLAIDPKGVVGDPAFEPAAFLGNQWEDKPDKQRLMDRRIDLFAEHLGLDRGRIRAWAIVQSVLSAWWSIEDEGECDVAAIDRINLLSASRG